MKAYRIISIDQAQAGMRLHADLHDRAGNLLLPASATLAAATLDALRRRGVEVLAIVDDSVTPEQLAAGRAQAMERIGHLFRFAGTGPANALLRRVVESYRAEEAV
jgi:hypothetical protein